MTPCNGHSPLGRSAQSHGKDSHKRTHSPITHCRPRSSVCTGSNQGYSARSRDAAGLRMVTQPSELPAIRRYPLVENAMQFTAESRMWNCCRQASCRQTTSQVVSSDRGMMTVNAAYHMPCAPWKATDPTTECCHPQKMRIQCRSRLRNRVQEARDTQPALNGNMAPHRGIRRKRSLSQHRRGCLALFPVCTCKKHCDAQLQQNTAGTIMPHPPLHPAFLVLPCGDKSIRLYHAMEII